MTQPISLRRTLASALRFAVSAWRRAPVGVALTALSLLVPVLVGDWAMGLGEALLILLAQLAAFVAGWTLLLRAATDTQRPGLAALAADGGRALASMLLCGLFLGLILLILGLVLLGVAGATGLAEGDDLTMAAAASITGGGWRNFVILALELAGLILMLTLWARLMPSGAATVAGGRVVSLASLGWTRGSGLRPAAGLIAALSPFLALSIWALASGQADGAWIDWLWAGVLSFIQIPLLAGYAAALWRAVRPQEA